MNLPMSGADESSGWNGEGKGPPDDDSPGEIDVLVDKSGWFVLCDLQSGDRWVATDSPAKIER